MERGGETENRGVEKVYVLIDPHYRWWGVAEVKALFRPSITAEILRIVILPNDQPNTYVWVPEKGGTFSFKSAYKLNSAS